MYQSVGALCQQSCLDSTSDTCPLDINTIYVNGNFQLKDGFSGDQSKPHALLGFASSDHHPLSFLFFFQFPLVGQIHAPLRPRAPIQQLVLLLLLASCATSSLVTTCSRRCRTSSASCRCSSDFSVSFVIEIAPSLSPPTSPLPLSRVLLLPLCHCWFHSAAAALSLLSPPSRCSLALQGDRYFRPGRGANKYNGLKPSFAVSFLCFFA